MKSVMYGMMLTLILLFATNAPAESNDRINKVQLCGHRGFTLNKPENALGSIKAARALGIYGCEVEHWI